MSIIILLTIPIKRPHISRKAHISVYSIPWLYLSKSDFPFHKIPRSKIKLSLEEKKQAGYIIKLTLILKNSVLFVYP